MSKVEVRGNGGFRVLVCGGRDFNGKAALFKKLDEVHRKRRITCIVHGAAQGADALGKDWAEANKVPHEPHPADWKRWGLGAIPKRNLEMLVSEIDLVVAAPGGKGTAHTTEMAALLKIPVQRVRIATLVQAGT